MKKTPPALADHLLLLYQAEDLGGLCRALQKLLSQHLPHHALFIGFRPQTFRFDFYVWPPQHESLAEVYKQEGYQYDIWMKRSPVHPGVMAVRHSDYTPEPMLRRSLFYQRILKQFNSLHGASLVSWRGKDWLAMATLHRSPQQGDFTDEEMLLLKQIQPHFSRVVRRLAAGGEEELRRQSIHAFVRNFPGAFILLNFKLEVQQFNSAARGICHELAHPAGEGRLTKPERTPRLPAEITAVLEKMARHLARTRRAPRGGKISPAVVLSTLRPGLEYHVTYIPETGRGLSTGLFLLVLHLTSAKIASAQLAALTPRQQEVVRQVAEGRTNLEIARRLGKSVSTVRHQVSAALLKLGFSRRFQLASLLKEAPAPESISPRRKDKTRS